MDIFTRVEFLIRFTREKYCY